MRKQTLKVRLLSLITLCGIVIAFASCSNDDVAQGTINANTENDKNLTSFVAGEPVTRTSLNYDDGAFFWDAGDYIYVQDDNGDWQKSSNAPTEKTASFKFLVPGQYTNKTSYKVYYPGKNSSKNGVSISALQKQTVPNSTAHIGEVGDCGTADAQADGGMFRFRLDHQAAILVFQPFTKNSAVKNCYLTKIEVLSDKDITGSYTLDAATGELTGTGNGKKIEIETKSGNNGSKGFSLNTGEANVATNGTYVVIRPGKHTLTVRYWIKDYVTEVEGVITKAYPSFDYEKNDYYDMTANLNVTDYDGAKYYMWDARNNFWNEREWNSADPWQPVREGLYSNYGKDNFYNNMRPAGNAAVYSCRTLPNANEMAWYVKSGDPRWDGEQIWTAMGHLHKGGMWFLKKLYINQMNDNRAPSPVNEDMRGNDRQIAGTPAQGAPGDKARYFFLPALGQYHLGAFSFIGTSGYYWTSTGAPEDSNWAYFLKFDRSSISLFTDGSEQGNYVMNFE